MLTLMVVSAHVRICLRQAPWSPCPDMPPQDADTATTLLVHRDSFYARLCTPEHIHPVTDTGSRHQPCLTKGQRFGSKCAAWKAREAPSEPWEGLTQAGGLTALAAWREDGKRHKWTQGHSLKCLQRRKCVVSRDREKLKPM